MTTIHLTPPSIPPLEVTPEQHARLHTLTEEWQVLNGYAVDTQGEGGEHQQALEDLEAWNNEKGQELKMLEDLVWAALGKAYERLHRESPASGRAS